MQILDGMKTTILTVSKAELVFLCSKLIKVLTWDFTTKQTGCYMDVIDVVRWYINKKAFIVTTSWYIHLIAYLMHMFIAKDCIWHMW